MSPILVANSQLLKRAKVIAERTDGFNLRVKGQTGQGHSSLFPPKDI